METIYNVNTTATEELLETLDSNKDVFFRFQDKNLPIGEKSWGMIYRTEEEALEDGSDVLNGKSCMPTVAQVWNWVEWFNDKDYVLVAFDGVDTGEEGCDGEYVARCLKVLNVFDIEQVYEACSEYIENYEWC